MLQYFKQNIDIDWNIDLKWVSQNNCDALCDLVPFVQFKKRGEHP